VAADELKAAGQGVYDEIITGDITIARPELTGRFDLILSWQVLEHVPSTRAALDTMHRYLKPGGRMVSQLSGRYAAYALLARAIPYPVSRTLMSVLLDSDPADKFPTKYHGCDPRSLRQALAQWSSYEITPRYKGGSYFRFSRGLERAYLVYENWIERTARVHLATHYVISAVK
jgi:SAM-dependent methyltransferase